jgi:hypothetical protein
MRLYRHTCFPSVVATVLVSIFYLISMLINLLVLFKATFSDPGIIPRKDITLQTDSDSPL